MTTSVKQVLISAVLAVGLVAAPALAATANRGAEIGFDVGRTNFSPDVSDESATSFGVRGGYHFNKRFQLEGQLASAAADEQDQEATLSTLFVNGVYNFRPTTNIRPYVLAGVGQAELEFDLGPFSVDDTGAAYQVGAGSRFFFGRNKRMAARVEATRMREETFSDSSNYTNVVTGLTWKLGRKS